MSDKGPFEPKDGEAIKEVEIPMDDDFDEWGESDEVAEERIQDRTDVTLSPSRAPAEEDAEEELLFDRPPSARVEVKEGADPAMDQPAGGAQTFGHLFDEVGQAEEPFIEDEASRADEVADEDLLSEDVERAISALEDVSPDDEPLDPTPAPAELAATEPEPEVEPEPEELGTADMLAVDALDWELDDAVEPAPPPEEEAEEAFPGERTPSGDELVAAEQAAAADLAEEEEPAPWAVDELSPITLTPLPLEQPLPEGKGTWLDTFGAFRRETQNLARQGQWTELAAVSAHALTHAPYALRATRSGMLLDLARVYRDRLNDGARAEEAFALLAREEPANAEALAYLVERLGERADWGPIFDMYMRAVEATWDPNERLEWTRAAAGLALERLGDAGLAIRAWEHLWSLGDAVEESSRELSRLYRAAGRWEEMGAFLQQQAERLDGAAKLVVLRELAEVRLSGQRDPDAASEVLELIVGQSPQDVIATLQLARVYAQRGDWEALGRLEQQAAAREVPAEAALDLQHLAADALWQAGKLEEAVEIYDRILEGDPTEPLASERKTEYLTRTEQFPELLDLLVAKADSTEDDDKRAELVAEAATLAEEQLDEPTRAVQLWERRISLDSEHLESYQALARLYEALDDPRGVARALEGQLALTKELKKRIELYLQLGEYYAKRLGDDERAEACWKEVLALDPSHQGARDELIELHRRRGAFDALNTALIRQIWATADPERAHRLCLMAAENLDENFDEPERSVEAWRRVLDFAPFDLSALAALRAHYATLERRRDLIAVLEQEIRALEPGEERIARTLEVGALWQEEERPKAAAAAYEAILRWQPGHAEAIDWLVEIYREAGQVGRAIGLLEHASTLERDPEAREALLRRVLELLPEDDHRGRFFLLRRILLLGDGRRELLEELRGEAEKAELWAEMPWIYGYLIGGEADEEQRTALLRELAETWEHQLESPQLAYLTLQRVFLAPSREEGVEEELARLAGLTERRLDLLALLDRLTTPEFELEQRKAVVRQRAAIFEKELGDIEGAIREQRRLLELDPGDPGPLAELSRLAEEHDRWAELDLVLAELWDRAEDEEQRGDLLARRVEVRRARLEDASGAFDLLAQQSRLAPEDEAVIEAIAEDAEALQGWGWVLPMLEGGAVFETSAEAAQGLSETAQLYDGKLADSDRAYTLTAAAFMAQPSLDELGPRLEQLAEADERYESLADTLRLAAAGCDDLERTVALLGRIAAIYEEKLDQRERAIDVHSRLLYLKEDQIPSLEVMIAWHRERQEWSDLRDRLRQRVRLAGEEEDRVPWLLEVAEISESRLGDAEEALAAFGEVLELAPDNERAQQGLDGLVRSLDEPNLRLRWLQMQLKTAPEERAVELRLEIAGIQEEEIGDSDAAMATLEQVVEEQGPLHRAAEELLRLRRKAGQWRELVLLLQARAAEDEDEERKLGALEEARAICNERLADSGDGLWQELYRSMLALRPSDRTIRVHLARSLRRAGRFEELAGLLQENVEQLSDLDDRVAIRYELARIQALNLGQVEQACLTWQKILEEAPEEVGALLALARAAAARGDVEAYVDARHRQAKLLPPAEAALVLCHLAEVADENEVVEERMVPLYREARTLDPQNVPAMEALKGIGRRLKNLRPAAALLPLEGERDLSWAERAQRLGALGNEALESDLGQALEWYRRALAVDPDNQEAWLSLAAALEEVPDRQEVFRALHSWLQAVERAEALDPEKLAQEAERLYHLALAARDANLEQTYRQRIQQAHDMAPHHAPSALARAQMVIEAGDHEEANALLNAVLTHNREELSEEQLVDALYARAVTWRKLGRLEQAQSDMREVLHLAPLHAEGLAAMGEMMAQGGRTAAAIEVQIRALTAVQDAHERADLYYRLGVLWEDGLGNQEEAGVCYELALAEGLDYRDLLHRALRHLQRTGRLDQSLEVVDSLLPTAEEPEELATLWLVRGEIFAAREGEEEAAVEAFDMALSYDPARQEAREGLTRVLERQGDWDQLLQVLEATCDVGTPQQQGAALRRMADICAQELGDPDRGEQYLRRSVDVFPTKEALETLEEIYTFDSGRLDERRDVLGLLTAFGPPWFDRVLELAKLLLSEEKPWAWCLISPLLGVSQVEQDIKAVIQAMRKEYERPPMLCPPADAAEKLRHGGEDGALTAVLAELGEGVHPLGVSVLDDAGDGNAIPIGETTTMGKAFAAVAEAVGLGGTLLYRTQSLQESICVVNSRPNPAVVVRTDVMQQLVHAEVGFLFAFVLELAKPGHRVMAAMPGDGRDQLIPALWRALGFSESGGRQVTRLAERIREGTDEETRTAWAEKLQHLADEDPVELSRSWWRATLGTARRAGLLAGADLRQVFRVLSRLEEGVARPRVVARMEELDQYVATSEILKDLVAFAASPAFGELMREAQPAETE